MAAKIFQRRAASADSSPFPPGVRIMSRHPHPGLVLAAALWLAPAAAQEMNGFDLKDSLIPYLADQFRRAGEGWHSGNRQARLPRRRLRRLSEK
jgi:hypothetical protein